MPSIQLLNFAVKLALALSLAFVGAIFSADPFTTSAPVSLPGAAAGLNTPAAELLDPDRAFQPQVRRRDLGTAEVKFEVVPGYYLYRDRLRVESVSVPLSSAGGKLKSDAVAAPAALAVSMPHGRMVDDPTFGHVEIFDKTITFTIDLNISPAAGGAARGGGGKTATKFIVTSQGCAKAGVCFPPQQHVFALPATVSHSREAANAAWVPPVSAATSLGFGRPKLAPEQSSIGK